MEISENTQSSVCSPSRKNDLLNRLQNYTLKKPNEPFKTGQKYYIVDDNVPNCVNSINCTQTFRKGEKSRRLNKDTKQFEQFEFDQDKCFSSDAQYNTGNEKKLLESLVNSGDYDANGESNKFKTKIWNTKNYKYEVNSSNPEIYYRTCPFYGCNSGTSALDISKGGKRKKNKKTKRNQMRRTRRR